MRAFVRALALLLAILWMPVTSHCALETVLGWTCGDRCADACSEGATAGTDHAETDACATVEEGGFLSTANPLIVAAPHLTVLLHFESVHATLLADVPALAPPSWAEDHPRDWMPTRHVVSRAVAPARAPALS